MAKVAGYVIVDKDDKVAFNKVFDTVEAADKMAYAIEDAQGTDDLTVFAIIDMGLAEALDLD